MNILVSIVVALLVWATLFMLAGVLGFLADAAPFLVIAFIAYCLFGVFSNMGKEEDE
jgi:hypothetical protein